MLLVGGYSNSLNDCLAKANSTLVDGSAYQKFLDLCNVHGGDLNSLPNALNSVDILADKSGYIAKINTEKIGIAGILLKAGRATAADIIEPTAGIAFHVKIGSQVRGGDKIFTLYGKDASLFAEAKKLLLSSVEFSEEKVPTENLIAKILA